MNKLHRKKDTGRMIPALVLVLLLCLNGLQAQEDSSFADRYVMEDLLDATPVKEQGPSGTCWSFATVSFLESELLRTGKGMYDLSEMYAVRAAYLAKAEKYVRMHGTINFGEGGEANDVTDAFANAGMVPQSIFPGPGFTVETFDFEGMDRELKDYVNRVIHAPEENFDPDWKEGFVEILDRYLGEVPSTFAWQGRTYSPQSFAESLGLTMDDYVLIGSFLHHPFYTGFVLEIPDNWSWEIVYNVPLDVLMEALDRSLETGFTVVWAADVSEPGFSYDEGMVVVREGNGVLAGRTGQAIIHGSSLQEGSPDVTGPGENHSNRSVTPEERQEAFDRYETQDDHAMHIIGKAHDPEGNRYYYIKNSWGSDNALDGYLFASWDYLRFKTISLFVNKHALDPELLEKLRIP